MAYAACKFALDMMLKICTDRALAVLLSPIISLPFGDA